MSGELKNIHSLLVLSNLPQQIRPFSNISFFRGYLQIGKDDIWVTAIKLANSTTKFFPEKKIIS
jgi:hypothetical protein